MVNSVIDFVMDGERISLGNENGINYTNASVLNYLRERLNRTGTKEGCAEGDCGACTIVVVDLKDDDLRYRSLNSCIQFMPSLDGKILYTVESLRSSEGNLHPVQSAMVDCHASQCGFCTPGFVMSLFALFKTNPDPTRLEVSDAISGNLCRCTGYRPILDAGTQMYDYPSTDNNGLNLAAGDSQLSVFEQQLKETLLSLQQAKQSKRFVEGVKTFHSPTTIPELTKLLDANPEATVLAGGTDVGLWVSKKHMDLKQVVYLGKVAELEYINNEGGVIEIGAMTTLEEAFTRLVQHYPQMSDLYKRFASLPIRNAGTLVGNLANGSPIGDAAPALIVLNATVVLRKGDAQREIPLHKLYLDYMHKDMAPNEFIQAVRIPLPKDNQLLRFYKLTKRFEQDISALLAAFHVELKDNKVETIRICYGGMAATSKRAEHCERILLRQSWNEKTIEAGMAALEQDYQPLSDMRASANYRMLAAKNLLKKFYLETSSSDLIIDVRSELRASMQANG